MKTKAWMRSHFCREENTNIAEKRSVEGKKGKKRRVIHLCFSCIRFSSNGCKTSNMGINGFTSQANKWATLPSKKKKEDTYFSSDSFLAAFYAYRQNHKATSDGAAVRKTKTKTKKTQTNQQTIHRNKTLQTTVGTGLAQPKIWLNTWDDERQTENTRN